MLKQTETLSNGAAISCADTPLPTLQRALGRASGLHLHELSWGRDPRAVSPHEPDKSVGNEETFERDVDDAEVIHAHLLRLSDQVAGRLRSSGYVGRTVSLKVRFADFTTITRAVANSFGHLRYSSMIMSETLVSLLDTHSVDLVVFHKVTYDIGTVAAQASRRRIPYGIVHHFDNRGLFPPGTL